MKRITIRVAGCDVGLGVDHELVPRLAAGFVVDEPAQLWVSCTAEDLRYEAERFEVMHQHEAPSDVYLESFVMLRKVADGLVAHDALLVHGAVVAVGDNAFLFTAPSGTGKTTHAMQWVRRCPDAYVLNDDKPFVKIPSDASQAMACGSPWTGKEEVGVNATVPLRAIVLMERAQHNVMRRIGLSQAFPELLAQVYRPDDEAGMRHTLRLIQRLDTVVDFWRFEFDNYASDSFDVAYQALCGTLCE